MLDLLIDLFERFGTPVLEMVLVFVLGFMAMAMRKLPGMLLGFAKAFEENAKKTESETDDVAAKLLVAFAESFSRAAEKELVGKKAKKKSGS